MSRFSMSILPALLVALMVVAVWYGGVTASSVAAQDPMIDPVLNLSASTLDSDNVVIATDVLTVEVRNFGAGRVWLYLWHDSDDVGSDGCLSNAVDANLREDGVLNSDGGVSFTMDVTVPPFFEGVGNRFCLLRRDGSYVASEAFEVDVRPSTYLMKLEISEIALAAVEPTGLLETNGSLTQDFRIDGGRGLSEWSLPQRRGGHDGVGDISDANSLVSVDGQWSACPEEGDLVVGCRWEDVVEIEDRTNGPLRLPGSDMVLRLQLPQDADNLAAERFVVFWGPVDLWLLGTQQTDDDPGHVQGEVEPQSFVVHSDHLAAIASELNSRVVQLTPGEYVDLSISKSSNLSGHTFFSLVSCNDDYLDALGSSSEVLQQKTALQDCTRLLGPSFAEYGSNLPADANLGHILGWQYLREAWLKHDVDNGLGMSCKVTPTVYTDFVTDLGGNSSWVDSWSLDIVCRNDVELMGEADALTKDTHAFEVEVEPDEARCERVLGRAYAWGDMAFVGGSGDRARVEEVRDSDDVVTTVAVPGVDTRPKLSVKCGWGPEDVEHVVGGSSWIMSFPGFYTRYNAVRSFYSFVMEWEETEPTEEDEYGCGAMLLPHSDGVATYNDAGRWRLGALPSSRCEVLPDDDAINVGLYVPEPPELDLSPFEGLPTPIRSLIEQRLTFEYAQEWGRYGDHAVHFAVYISGMPGSHDYQEGESEVSWRRVALGAWHYGEGLSAEGVGDAPRALLGVVHPVGIGGGGLDVVPSMSEMYDGLELGVTRDYADEDGYVRLYVVPCRPLYATDGSDGVSGACEHLPARVGAVSSASFEAADRRTGPFYVEERDGLDPEFLLHYSYKFTVDFQGRDWGSTDERRISPPLDEVVADGGCQVSSELESGTGYYWPGVTVSGGDCNSDSLDTLPVLIKNDNADFSDNLVVYVTGGRTGGMDMVRARRIGGEYADAEPFGRLGLRERLLSLDGVGSETLYVNPDLAGEDGEVWVMAYSCGSEDDGMPLSLREHGAEGHCPRLQKYRDPPLYDVPVPPSFAIRIHFTSSELQHTDVGPVCQGDDCDPLVPVLRDALLDSTAVSCDVRSYPAGVSGLVYWPDRLVYGGACAPEDLSPVSVSIGNGSMVGDQNLVVYATGGRTPGLEAVQVVRGGGQGATGGASGATGLREVKMSLAAGDSGSVLVDADLADEDGRVWLFAYLCSGPGASCPSVTAGDDPSTYAVERRPLFQVLVQYDVTLLMLSDFSVCRGDDCLEVYALDRVGEPDGISCSVSATASAGQVYWPDRVVGGGACDRDELGNVEVSFSSSSDASLAVYATGGRTVDLDKVQVLSGDGGGGAGEPLGRLGLRERQLTITAGGSDTVLVNPDLAGAGGAVWLLAYVCDVVHGDDGCPLLARPVVNGYDLPARPSFVVLVRFTEASGIVHSGFGPVCQGDDCDPLVPIVREALPDAPDDACGVSSYPAGGLERVYWPDRLVSGGACSPGDVEEIEVEIHNASGLGDQHLVVYATGGRGPGLELVQVQRAGEPAGRVGLRRLEFTLDSGGTGRVLVSSDLADAGGRILVLAYLCSDAENCPGGVGNDGVTFEVDRRPLFQVLVDYDEGFLTDSGLSICRGDRCSETYTLGTVSHPSGDGCGVLASYSVGQVYWSSSVVTEGGCDRDTLADVSVTFSLPASAVSSESLTVYVTGGRSLGLGEVQVKRAPATPSADAGALDYLVQYPFDLAPYAPDSSSGLANVVPVSSLVQSHDTERMRWLQAAHAELYSELEAKSWVQDGLDAVEKRGLDALLHVAVMEADTAAAAKKIAAMPFLETFEELDYLTLWGLVAAGFRDANGSDVSRVYAIADHVRFVRGITDDDRLLVMGVTTMSDRGKVKARLTQGYPDVEYSNVAGYTVRVVWAVAREDSSVDSYVLQHLAKSLEAVQREMGLPFPVRDVVLYMDDDAVLEGAGGVNYGYAISAPTEYETAEDALAARHLKSTIVHEVAHYYWRDSRSWINEGLASVFEVMVGPEFGLGEDVTLNEKESGNLACDLPNLRSVVEGGDPRHWCNYYLGQRLFLALRERLGASGFGDALRALYGRVQECRDSDVHSRPCGTIDDVRAAFPLSVRSLIDAHWGTVAVDLPVGNSDRLGRLGVREVFLTVAPSGFDFVTVNPDLAGEDGEVWLFAYRCDVTHGDSGCPFVERPVVNGYDLPKGPDFAVRVRFMPESGVPDADLQKVCVGMDCDFERPWLRRAEPVVGACGAGLGTYWPDRVIRGGDCLFRGTTYGAVSFENLMAAEEKFVVYATGDAGGGFGDLPVYGVLQSGGGVVSESGVQLGRLGLKERRLTASAGGSAEVYVRSEMAGDDGDVWLFVYRCLASYGDAGCPLVGQDVVRPEYGVGIRPTFIVRAEFVNSADVGRSNLDIDCSGDVCEVTAVFRDSEGNTLPGTAEFRVDAGTLGADGSTAMVSQVAHDESGDGFQFVETLHLPAAGGIVNVTVELLGDGAILRGRAGRAASVDSLSVRVMRCADDEASCHLDSLEEVTSLSRGDRFVVAVLGHDSAGDVGLDAELQSETRCTDGIVGDWPVVRLSTSGLRSHPYGTGQLGDRGYAGCAYWVTDDAEFGAHGYTVTYSSGGVALSASGSVTVARSASDLSFLGLTGPAQIESGETGTFLVVGYNSAGLPVGFTDGCLAVDVSGELTGDDACASTGLLASGFAFDVMANDDVVLDTDSSVGVTYRGLSVRRHVLVVPVGQPADPPVVAGVSHITGLTVTPEGSQLRLNWSSSPIADFASLRVQVWVLVGDEDVFLPGCSGGDVLATSTVEVFCMMSHGQSGDVYHAAVGFFRYDGTAVPVETAEWTRP